MYTTRSAPKDPGDEPPIRARLILHKMSESRYEIPGHGRVLCRLWRMEGTHPRLHPSVYAVEMGGMGERRFCLIGREEETARRIFALLVRHTVTPCGLRDVLEELIE